MKILIVEDDLSINNLLKKSLTKYGYDTISAFDGEEAASLVESEKIEFAIVDVMLPKIDGWELSKYLKEYNIPMIFLTAKDQQKDKLKGLHLGADDYMTKPFDILELIARIEVIKRRVYGTQIQENLIKRGTLEINPTNKQVMNQGEKVLLTPKEFDLLLELVINNNIILTREYLYKAVWDKEFSDESRTLDLHIQRIRNKLFQSGELKTVYGTGYLLEITE